MNQDNFWGQMDAVKFPLLSPATTGHLKFCLNQAGNATFGIWGGTTALVGAGWAVGAKLYDVTNGVWYTNLGTTTVAAFVKDMTLGTASGTQAILGNVTIGGTLGVTGASTIGALSATTGTFSSTLGVTGTSTLGAVTCTTLGPTGTFTSTGLMTTTAGVASGTARKIGGLASSLATIPAGVTNTASETQMTGYTIPANTLVAGTVIRISGEMEVSNQVGATTTQLLVRLGTTSLSGTALVTSAAKDAVDGEIVTFMMELICHAAPGASVNIEGHGYFVEQEAAGAGAFKSASLPATNFATNGALIVEMNAKMSAADGTTMTPRHFTVEIIG